MSLLDLFRQKEKPADALLLNEIDQIFDPINDYSRQMLERIWFRNLLYYMGEQWLEFLRTTGTFSRRYFPDFVPTPVSNEIRDYVRSQKALLLNRKLVPKILPNTNDKVDQIAAWTGEQLMINMDSAGGNRIADEKEKIAIWTVICGTGFARTYPFKEGGKWFMDSKGDMMSTGDERTDCTIPFNVRVDPIAASMEDMAYIGVQSLKRKEWIEDTFGILLKRGDDSPIIDYQKRLMKIVSQVSPWKGIGLETAALTDIENEELYIFKEVEFRPSKRYPHGKYVVSVGGMIAVNAERLPIKSEAGQCNFTLTDFHFDYMPGRFWSDGGVNDLISPQNSINQIDQALEINRKGLARPRIITPGDISLKRVNEGGQGLLVITYDPLLAGGKAPEIDHGEALPDQVIKERMNHKEQIQSAAGDPKNILKGMPPSSTASGIQVDILRDTAMQGHQPDVERFDRSWERVGKKRLLVAQELYTEKRMIKIVGRGRRVMVRSFRGADLRGNTDLRLELDSGLSTTKAGQNSMLMDMAKEGFLGPVGDNPEIRQDFLTRVGLSGFAEYENIDISRAEDENSMISAGSIESIFVAEVTPDGQIMPEVLNMDPIFKFDNHVVHAEIHRRFILSDEFRDLDEKARVVLITHCTIHKILAQAEMAAQAAAIQAAQGPAPKPGAPAPPGGGGAIPEKTSEGIEYPSGKQPAELPAQ